MTTTHLPDQISLTPADADAPLYLESMVVRGTVAGNNCLTEMILTFKNDTGRTLEGELNFPLPQSGVVSGFGYEINGRMVDGVIVEKEAARVAFEKEVRSGGKAALVEHVAGNAFKTRVYPIPPSKPISVKVVYLSDVEVSSDGSSYSLPLCIVKPLKSLTLHLEIRGSTPSVRDADEGLAELKFTATGNDFASDVQLQNFKSKKNLMIGLSAVAKKDEPQVLSSVYEGDSYFLIHDLPAEAAVAPTATAMLKHVAVVWDASLSMENVSKKRVLKVIGDLFALPALQNAKATLIPFREVTEAAVDVQSGQELVAKLNAIEYDGGTDIANLRWLGAQADHRRTCAKGHALVSVAPAYDTKRWNCDGCAFAKDQEGESWHCKECGYDLCSVCYSEPAAGTVTTPYDKILLVTDGFSNLSDDVPSQLPTSPVFVLNIGTQCNSLSLTLIANKTGGQFLDLTRIPDDNTVLQAITSSAKFSFLSASFDTKDFADVLPSQPQPILAGEKFSCAGKLLRGSGTLTLNYGVGGKVTATRQVNVTRAAGENGLVAKIWAGMKVKELAVFADQNKKELLAVARKYGIVTPGASILVLSDLEAYLKHGIEPSEKGLPEVYKVYARQKADKQAQEDQRVKSKLSLVTGWWLTRKAWYAKDFTNILKQKHRTNWDALMRKENPKIFAHNSAPPALPPAPGPHTASLSEADADAHVAAHPPAVPSPRRASSDADEEEKEEEEAPSKHKEAKASMASRKKMKDKRETAEAPQLNERMRVSPAPASAAGLSINAGPSPSASFSAGPSLSASSAMPSLARRSSASRPIAPVSTSSMAEMAAPMMAELAAPMMDADASMCEGEQMAEAEELSTPAPPPPAPAPASGAPAPGASAPAPNPDDDGQTQSGIAIKAWTPDMPYLNKIKAEAKTQQYAAYLKQRKDYRSSPAFYLDVATYFFSEPELKQYGHRVLTSIADLGLEEPGLLRIVGYKLSNEGLLRQAAAVFGRVLRLREYEPQSWRDLGNVLADLGLYQRALECFWKVVTGQWDSNYSEVELTVLMEANRVLDIVKRRKLAVPHAFPADLVLNMECDLRISCGWDTNATDVDLHVREPDGTECYYGNKNTPTGGLVSRDFTQGYGPEEYMIKVGLPGTYIIKVRYYASHAQTLSGGTTVLLNVFTDFARGEYERCQKTTVRLQQSCDNFEVARIDFNPSGPRKAFLRGLEEEWGKELEQRAAWAEQWEAYEQRQRDIQRWQSDEQSVVAANQNAIRAAEQRYIAKRLLEREAQQGSGKNLAVPAPAAPTGGSSPRGGSGKNLAPGAPADRAPSPGKKSLGDRITGLFK